MKYLVYLIPLLISINTAAQTTLLLSTEALADKLNDVVVVDTRDRNAYINGHIPGAAHLHFAELSETRDGVSGMLRSDEVLREMLANRGLAPENHIVIYSAMENPWDFVMAARLFYVFDYFMYPNVSILDGGIKKWIHEGRPLDTGSGSETRIDIDSIPEMPNTEILVDKDEILRVLNQEDVVLSDQRSYEEYSGLSSRSNGHIPGAISHPYTAFFATSQNLFKTGDDLLELLTTDGINKSTRIITYCNSGHTSTIGYFGYRLAGFENVAMYDGSMLDWSDNVTERSH